MTLASAVVADVRATLIDAAKATWSDADLLAYLNDAIAMVCGLYGDLYIVVNNAFGLTPGVRQALPAGGVVLVDIPYNGQGSTVTQQAVTEVGRVHPTWAAETATTDVRFYMYDRRSPATFLVYPPAASGATVSIVYGAVPSAIASGDPVPLPDWTERALWALVLSKAYAKSTQRQDLTKSKDFLSIGMSIFDKWAEGKARVGLTAGASAPEVLVREVVARIGQWRTVSEEPVTTTEEHMVFKLPRQLVG